MKKLLVVNAHPYGDNIKSSNSLNAAKKFCDGLKGYEIEWLNLVNEEIPYVDEQLFDYYLLRQHGKFDIKLSKTLENKLIQREKYIKQLFKATHILFVYPMYALSFPAILKEYIDTIVISPITYYYDNNYNLFGRCVGKKAMIISSSALNWDKDSEFQKNRLKRIDSWDDFGYKQLLTCMQIIGLKKEDIDYLNISNTQGATRNRENELDLVDDTIKQIKQKWEDKD